MSINNFLVKYKKGGFNEGKQIENYSYLHCFGKFDSF
jgi:hypothetical protein